MPKGKMIGYILGIRKIRKPNLSETRLKTTLSKTQLALELEAMEPLVAIPNRHVLGPIFQWGPSGEKHP